MFRISRAERPQAIMLQSWGLKQKTQFFVCGQVNGNVILHLNNY